MTQDQFKNILKFLPRRDTIAQKCFRSQRYDQAIPAQTLETLLDYLIDGTPMGSFCQAVIQNDLFGAMGRADHSNSKALPAIAAFVYNEFPMAAREYEEWIELHRVAQKQASQS